MPPNEANGRRITYHPTKLRVLEVLETHTRAELTCTRVAELSECKRSTAERILRELRDEHLARSRHAVTLPLRPLLWSRVAV